jgi:hypothetical protein
MRDIRGLQLNLVRAKKGVSYHVSITTMLKKDIKVEDSHISALNDHVQALQAQAAILLRINKALSDDVSEEKKEKEMQDKLNDKWSLFKRLDTYVAGSGKWKRIV